MTIVSYVVAYLYAYIFTEFAFKLFLHFLVFLLFLTPLVALSGRKSGVSWRSYFSSCFQLYFLVVSVICGVNMFEYLCFPKNIPMEVETIRPYIKKLSFWGFLWRFALSWFIGLIVFGLLIAYLCNFIVFILLFIIDMCLAFLKPVFSLLVLLLKSIFNLLAYPVIFVVIYLKEIFKR